MSSSSKLMDTEPGGEQTQYEGVNTFNKHPVRQKGTLAAPSEPSEADLQVKGEAKERGERTAENIRYGQVISEGGMSGFTTGQEGEAKQSTYGRSESHKDDQNIDQTRQEQGYGPGSGVGG